MKIKNTIIATMFALMSFTLYAAEGAIPLTDLSTWTNQNGSTFFIDAIDDKGRLSGTYVNRAPDYNCQNIPHLVTGWTNGETITFNTTFERSTESCDSITAWIGFYYDGHISTKWQLVANGSSSISEIGQGNDVFKLNPVLFKKSPSSIKPR